jgi:hypothetical protein
MEAWIAEALAAQESRLEYPFTVVRLADGRVVGSTRYMDVQAASKGVEIGWTWYAPETWGTVVNPEAKFLLLRHAFEAWGAIRVQLKTDLKNLRSQAAIKKLGAKEEGVLRRHRFRRDGTIRDSVIFSIIIVVKKPRFAPGGTGSLFFAVDSQTNIVTVPEAVLPVHSRPSGSREREHVGWPFLGSPQGS